MRKRPKLTELRFDKWADDLKSWIAESVSPFENDTAEKQTERIERSKRDLLYCCKTYLPHYFPGEFGEFHEEWEDLSEIRDEVVLVGAPREHAKSTFFSFAIPIRNIALKLRNFQMIVSDTNDQAAGFTLPIRLELEENTRLRNDFGAEIGEGPTWQKGDFTTAGGVRTLARGRGEKVRGLKNRQHRPDFAVVDDYENDVNVRNPKLVKQGIDWLRKAVIGSMGAGFTFVMVGNLFHPKSVLAQMMAETDETGAALYVSRIYDCWIDFGKPGQRPLWPSVWPDDRLRAKARTMGSRAFNAEMRNLVADDDSPFPEKWIRYYEPEDVAGLQVATASFVDPSAKNGESNDYKAVVTVGLDRDKMTFYVLHAWIRRASIADMFAAAYQHHDEYGGGMVGIEQNMLQDFLHDAIANYARDVGRYIPWFPVTHTTNKEGRIIGALSYLVEHGRLLFCRGHSDQDLLVEQLMYLTNATVNDDGPDALEGAVSLLQSTAGPLVYASAEPEGRKRVTDDNRPNDDTETEPGPGAMTRARGMLRGWLRRGASGR